MFSSYDSNVAVADSGASGHYLTIRCKSFETWKATNKISVKLPNGVCIQNTHETHLPIPQLPESARLARIFPELSSVSLISISQLYNAGCIAIFDKQKVTISLKAKVILSGVRNFKNGLWEIDLTQK